VVVSECADAGESGQRDAHETVKQPGRFEMVLRRQTKPQVKNPKSHVLLRSLAFAGSVAALLRRLRGAETPKKRHLVRSMRFVGSMLAASAIVAVVVWWRRGRPSRAAAGDRRGAQSDSPKPKTPDAEPSWEGAPTDADAPQDVAIPVPS
jgi:hypothetical protein